jgi:hypothetical protein
MPIGPFEREGKNNDKEEWNKSEERKTHTYIGRKQLISYMARATEQRLYSYCIQKLAPCTNRPQHCHNNVQKTQ